MYFLFSFNCNVKEKRKYEREKKNTQLNGQPQRTFLDLLHAHRVSQQNYSFKVAQSVRYPEFTSFIPYANPLRA